MHDFVPYTVLQYLGSELWKKLMPAEDRFNLFFLDFSTLLVHIIDLLET